MVQAYSKVLLLSSTFQLYQGVPKSEVTSRQCLNFNFVLHFVGQMALQELKNNHSVTPYKDLQRCLLNEIKALKIQTNPLDQDKNDDQNQNDVMDGDAQNLRHCLELYGENYLQAGDLDKI